MSCWGRNFHPCPGGEDGSVTLIRTNGKKDVINGMKKMRRIAALCTVILAVTICGVFSTAAAGPAVAKIGDTEFATLPQAVAAAGENGVGTEIVLMEEVTDCPPIYITGGKEITVDLNGHNIGFTGNGAMGFFVQGGALSLTGSGKVYEQIRYFAPVLMKGSTDSTAENFSVVTVGKDVTLEGWSGLFIDQAAGNANYGMVADVYGTLVSKQDKDGYAGHGLYVNGVIANTEGAVVKITLDGANVSSADGGNGMYLAGYARTEIRNSVVSSTAGNGTGIEIRAGELTISESEISGGSGTYQGAPNGNGSTSMNVALAVAQHTTKLPLSVTVESGTFTGGAAFIQADPQENGEEAISKIQLTIRQGTFMGQVYSENKTNFVENGTFSQRLPDEYGAGTFVQTENTDGTFTVAHVHVPGTEWFNDETAHWHICEECGGAADMAQHTFGDWTELTAATAEKEGLRERVCSVCSYAQSEVIPATGTEAGTETGTDEVENPETGEAPVVLWAVLALAGSAVCGTMMVRKKAR